MEALDSALFRIPELVDCRVSFGDKLHVEALVAELGQMQRLREAVQKQYPFLPVSVQEDLCRREDKPMYGAKRYVIREE